MLRGAADAAAHAGALGAVGAPLTLQSGLGGLGGGQTQTQRGGLSIDTVSHIHILSLLPSVPVSTLTSEALGFPKA